MTSFKPVAAGGDAGGPRRLHLVGGHTGQRAGERLVVADRLHGELAQRPVVAHDDLRAEALDQRPRQPVRNRCEETDEAATELRPRNPRGDDDPPQTAYPCIDLHHLSVAEDIAATDLVHAIGSGMIERFEQIVEHSAHADRLAPCVHPARGDHERQSLREMAEHFETGRARPNDHGRAELDHWHARSGQRSPHLLARHQVLAVHLVGVAEATQIDDACDARASGFLAEDRGHLPIDFPERSLRRHRVRQVVRNVHTDHRPGDRIPVEQVALDDLCLPVSAGQPRCIAGDAPHLVPALEQAWHQPAPDIARGPRGEHPQPHGLPPRSNGRKQRHTAILHRSIAQHKVQPRLRFWSHTPAHTPAHAPVPARAPWWCCEPVAPVTGSGVRPPPRFVVVSPIAQPGCPSADSARWCRRPTAAADRRPHPTR